MEVVVAQVVKRWHSVWAGRVQIPLWTQAFFSSDLLLICSHWVLGFLSAIEWRMHFLLSPFLLSFIIYHCKMYQL